MSRGEAKRRQALWYKAIAENLQDIEFDSVTDSMPDPSLETERSSLCSQSGLQQLLDIQPPIQYEVPINRGEKAERDDALWAEQRERPPILYAQDEDQSRDDD